MSNLNQRQVQKLLQKLSPQQIQMIKLLELPALQLEQRIKQEIEENPVLEEEPSEDQEEEQPKEVSVEEYFAEDDTPRYKYHANNYSPDDQKRPVYLTEGMSLHEYLIEQLGFKNLSEREMTLAKYMVGSIDDDGYLRRNLSSISDDIAFSLGIETSEERARGAVGIRKAGPENPDQLLRRIYEKTLRKADDAAVGRRRRVPRRDRGDRAPVAEAG